MSKFGFVIKPATKEATWARVALIGPTGAGKTWTGLTILQGLLGLTPEEMRARPELVGVIDSERSSARKYAGDFGFLHGDLTTGHPEAYIEAINAFAAMGVRGLFIDGISKAWEGSGGALELVDQATQRSRSKNSFTDGWREVTPLHHKLIDAILGFPGHVVVSMRAKMQYELEDAQGKKTPVKVGLGPVQRQGVEYEFDIVLDMHEATAVVSKTRCRALFRGIFKEPGAELGKTIADWLTDGAVPMAPPAVNDTEAYKLEYGPKGYRGKDVRSLTVEELGRLLAEGMELVSKNAGAKWLPRVSANMSAIRSVQATRAREKQTGEPLPSPAEQVPEVPAGAGGAEPPPAAEPPARVATPPASAPSAQPPAPEPAPRQRTRAAQSRSGGSAGAAGPQRQPGEEG